jgi:hypothetical protein
LFELCVKWPAVYRKPSMYRTVVIQYEVPVGRLDGPLEEYVVKRPRNAVTSVVIASVRETANSSPAPPMPPKPRL